ncbi:COG1470 family protein [Tessaracoccus sp. Y36]
MMNAVLPRIVRALLTSGLVALAVLVPHTAHAEDLEDDGTTGIALNPVEPDGSITDRARHSFHVQPGQDVTDHIRVANAGNTPLKVTVFATDAFNDTTGNFALLNTNDEPKGAGAWVTFGTERRLELQLGAQEVRIIPFTVTVPSNAAPGDHPAGIVVSSMREGDISRENRIANRMYVRVAGDLVANMTISSFSANHSGDLNPFDGSITGTATVSNNGNIALSGRVTLSGTTWFGVPVGQETFEVLDEVLPGNTRTVNFTLENVPSVGFANVKWLLQTQTDGDALLPPTLPVVERDAFVWALPLLAVVPLLLIVGGIVWWRWRRKVDAKRAAEWIAHTEAEAARKAQEASAQNDAPEPELVESGSK